jgi:hypothetical protein
VFPPFRLDEMYRAAVGAWQIPPDAFWSMTPREFWWVYDVRRPPPQRIGKTAQSDGFTPGEIERKRRKQAVLNQRLAGVTDPKERRRIVADFVREHS